MPGQLDIIFLYMKISSGVILMSRTVIDLDDKALDDAAAELGTTTKVATVNAALRRVAQQHASRRMLDDMLTMDLDLSAGTMRGAWREDDPEQ